MTGTAAETAAAELLFANHNILWQEDDFVCKPRDFCFRNLAPIEYGGISGDHNNDATKLFNPSDGKDKNIFDMYDELIECPWHCDFCHGIRQYHQEEGSERRCYYLK